MTTDRNIFCSALLFVTFALLGIKGNNEVPLAKRYSLAKKIRTLTFKDTLCIYSWLLAKI